MDNLSLSHLQFILLVAVTTAWLLWWPGGLLFRLIGLKTRTDLLVTISLQFALGMVFWPLLFLWTSTAGLHWSTKSAQLMVVAVTLFGAIALIGVKRQRWHHRYQLLRKADARTLSFVFLLFLTFFTRYTHIQSLILPAWVDSVHHTMVITVLMEQGYLPDTYAPYLPSGRFFYHWGFHAIVAFVSWITGANNAIDVARVLLIVGQVFNCLTLVLTYTMGRVWFGSQRVGLWGAALATLVSWFPAYYVSWGRYPHLVGMLLLAAIAICFHRLFRNGQSYRSLPASLSAWFSISQKQLPGLIAATLLLSGLILIHVRVAFFAFTLGMIFGLVALIKQRWKDVIHLVYIFTGAALLCLPWIIRLASNARLQEMVVRSDTSNNDWWGQYNSIPWGLVWIKGQSLLLAIATGGISVFLRWDENSMWMHLLAVSGVIVLCGALWNTWHFSRKNSKQQSIVKQANRREILSLVILYSWIILTGLIINGGQIGLPVPRFVHNSSAVISLYLPLSLVAGSLLAWTTGLFFRHKKSLIPVTVFCVSLVSLTGALMMQSVVNPETVLIDSRDIVAMEWITEEVPANAKFAVNSTTWLRKTHRGTDGGYWLTTLTGRESILPVGIYSLALPTDERERVNNILENWTDITSPQEKNLQSLLKAEAITHIYLGSKGGQLNELPLNMYPFLKEIYYDGPISIYKVVEDQRSNTQSSSR